MPNRKIQDLAEQGLTSQGLLDDRIDPKDGWLWKSGGELIASTAMTYNRAAAGDYGVVTAGAATYRLALSLSPFSRIRSAKGLKILDVAFHYGTDAAFTGSVDLLVQKAVYADNASPSLTNLTFTYDAAHDTAGERATANRQHLLVGTLSVPEYEETDFAWYSAELSIVLTAGLVNIHGGGMHFEHDYL
jgi:hypothetical protein